MVTGVCVVFQRHAGPKQARMLASEQRMAQMLCYASSNLSSLVAQTTSADKVGDALVWRNQLNSWVGLATA